MKKSTFHSYLLPSITMLSILCYVYLHKVAFDTTGHCPSSKIAWVAEEEDNQTNTLLLPEITLVKHFLIVAKAILTKG